MARVRFTDDFDFKPIPSTTVAYKAGWEGLVATPCASAAVKAGKAVRVVKRKAAEDVDTGGNADGDEQ